MDIQEILQSLRDCDYAECKEWADAIEAAMREKDAEIERLEEEIEWMREELMKNLQAQAETALNTEAPHE